MATTEGRDGPAAPTAPSDAQHSTCEPEFVGGLLASTWGHLFRQYPGFLERLWPLLHQELRRIFPEERAQVLMLREMILCALPVVGLHKESLAEELEHYLGRHTRDFVQRLVDFTVQQYGRKAYHLFIHGTSRSSKDMEDSEGRVTSVSFTRCRDRSSVATTRWTASEEKEHGNQRTRTTFTGFRQGGRFYMQTSIKESGFLGPEEHDPMVNSRPAAPPRGASCPWTRPS